jgi:hypothetical protein
MGLVMSQRPKRAVAEGQQTFDNFHTPMLHHHKKECCVNEESINTVKYNNF